MNGTQIHRAHPANIPGDFYVRDGCCTMCEVPFSEAPGLFAVDQDPDGRSHCYVARQPVTPSELEEMLGAIQCAEFQCIRYRGNDRDVQHRLVQLGEAAVCDRLPPDLQEMADATEAVRRQREPSFWERLCGWLLRDLKMPFR